MSVIRDMYCEVIREVVVWNITPMVTVRYSHGDDAYLVQTPEWWAMFDAQILALPKCDVAELILMDSEKLMRAGHDHGDEDRS